MGISLPQGKSEDELWLEYGKTKAIRIRDFFIRQYAPLVKYVAGKVALGMPKNVEFDDLVSCGTFGLIDAIEKFEPDRNIKFKTYAITRIRGSIFDELRQADWVPRSIRQKIHEIENAIKTLEDRLQRKPTEREVREHLKMDESEYNRTLMRIAGANLLSLDQVWISGDDKDNASLIENIEAPSLLEPAVSAERDEIRRIIIEVINNLPDKEKKIMVLYHYEELTLKEIGQILSITESRVSQLHSKAVWRIQQKLNDAHKGIMN